MKLKKGDTVKVIKGKDRGRTGKIEKIFPEMGKVLIPGINVYKKHTKPRGEKEPGGIIDILKPLPLANVVLMCPKCSKPTRIGFRIDKSGAKTRICRKCKAIL